MSYSVTGASLNPVQPELRPKILAALILTEVRQDCAGQLVEHLHAGGRAQPAGGGRPVRLSTNLGLLRLSLHEESIGTGGGDDGAVSGCSGGVPAAD